MDIQEMTSMSHFLLVMAGILALVAVILFFWLDIPKCVRMVFGKSGRRFKKLDKEAANIQKSNSILEKMPDMMTEKLEEATLPLYDDDKTQPIGNEETLPLIYDSAETELMDSKKLELIQDIVYVQDRERNEKGTE